MLDLKLRILLADKRIEQKEFANKTGIREATVSAYVNDKYKTISKDHINKMCEFFNCSISDLFEYIPDKKE